MEGEQRFKDSWKELGKDTVHWDEWSTNPSQAAGESLFDLATLSIPGGALSKLPKLGHLAAEAAERSEDIHPAVPLREPAPSQANSAPRNEPPRGGPPAPAPKPQQPMPPYGLTESKKPAPAPTPKPAEPALPKPSHYGPVALATDAKPTEPVPVPNGFPAGVAATPPLPVSPSHSSERVPEPSARSGDGGDGHARHSDDASQPGLSDEKRDEILALPKGSRPDPAEYLSFKYIEQHLEKFHEGATKFMPESNLAKYGIAQRDGTSFVMPKTEAHALINSVLYDPRTTEKALGLPEGFLDSNKVIRIDIDHPDQFDLRLPSGNEAGANEQWIPGGKLPDGASEAIVNGGDIPESDYRASDAFK
jgi:hypothetical protein